MLNMIKGINESIDALVDVVGAWSSCDYADALSKTNHSLDCLQEAKAALGGCNDTRLREGYLNDIEEVEDLIHAFCPFLSQKVQST